MLFSSNVFSGLPPQSGGFQNRCFIPLPVAYPNQRVRYEKVVAATIALPITALEKCGDRHQSALMLITALSRSTL
jgi:hypothetical protein